MPHDLTLCEELQPQIAAYALGEPEVDPALLEHLERCPDCQRDLHTYAQIARALPYSAPDMAPPASLRERIIAAVAQDQQPERQPPPTPVPPAAPPRRPRRIPVAWAAFAATFALMLALLGWNISLQSQVAESAVEIQADRSAWQTTIVILNNPGVRRYVIAGGDSYGQLWVAPQGRTGCLVAQGLPALGDDQTYHIWLMRGTEHQDGGVFGAFRGNAWVLLEEDQPLETYDSIMITIEPRYGAYEPTGPQVMRGELVSAGVPSSADRQQLMLLLTEASERRD